MRSGYAAVPALDASDALADLGEHAAERSSIGCAATGRRADGHGLLGQGAAPSDLRRRAQLADFLELLGELGSAASLARPKLLTAQPARPSPCLPRSGSSESSFSPVARPAAARPSGRGGSRRRWTPQRRRPARLRHVPSRRRRPPRPLLAGHPRGRRRRSRRPSASMRSRPRSAASAAAAGGPCAEARADSPPRSRAGSVTAAAVRPILRCHRRQWLLTTARAPSPSACASAPRATSRRRPLRRSAPDGPTPTLCRGRRLRSRPRASCSAPRASRGSGRRTDPDRVSREAARFQARSASSGSFTRSCRGRRGRPRARRITGGRSSATSAW